MDAVIWRIERGLGDSAWFARFLSNQARYKSRYLSLITKLADSSDLKNRQIRLAYKSGAKRQIVRVKSGLQARTLHARVWWECAQIRISEPVLKSGAPNQIFIVKSGLSNH